MANKDVSSPTSVQSAMVADARPIRLLVAGTKAMRAAGEEFLPRQQAESVANYEARKKRSFLFGATAKTVSDMTGKVFTKPIQVEKGVDAELQKLFDNVDNAGRHLNVFARDVFLDAMQPGVSFIYVDMPPAVERADGAPATIADEQQAGIRPYLKNIPLESLIGWKSEMIAGVETLTQIRIKECTSEPDPKNPYDNVDIDQIRVVSRVDGIAPCTWQTFRKNGTDDEAKWVQHASGTISQPEIQLFPVYTNRTDFMKACPPLGKLAELNIAHWQSSSDQRNILHVARVPILFGAGFTADDEIIVGASNMVQSSNVNAKLEYVEHTGAAIDAGDKDLTKLEIQMQAMGLQLLVDDTKGQSATGEIRDDAKENSPLAMMATALQDALTQAVQSMARFAKLNEPKAGDLMVSKDFGISGNRFDLQFLTQLCLGGKLSQETMWMELQRRGTLSDSFDPEVEAARVAAEAPEVVVPPGKGMPLN
jgi:hypothetical protein